MEKMALKRLTHSDLTFFKCYYSSQGEKPSKQKALNLNSDVFIDELYPNLRVGASDIKLPVCLHIYGPGLEDAQVLQRKILKSSGAKNWRLNGELVYSPEENVHRYDVLRPGDIALIGFDGEPEPRSVFIDFIAACREDEALYMALDGMLGRPMGRLTGGELKKAILSAAPDPRHPVFRFDLDDDLLSAAEGDGEASLRVFRHSGRVMSAEELDTARKRASDIGSAGEDFVAQYLQKQLEAGSISDYEWTSKINVVAPYDFKITLPGGAVRLADVKSTKGGFDTKMHISNAELITMAAADEYVIYRVYELSEERAKMRISGGMKTFARGLLDDLARLPAGVSADSISCLPALLEFDGPTELELSRDD